MKSHTRRARSRGIRILEDFVFIDKDKLINAIDTIREGTYHLSRDKEIFRLRLGLVDGKFHTLDYIGTQYGMSRERVRQIEFILTQKTLLALDKMEREAKKQQHIANDDEGIRQSLNWGGSDESRELPDMYEIE